MAEETPAVDSAVGTPVPAVAVDDVPVDGVPAQNLDTPQKDTVMTEASNEQAAVSLHYRQPHNATINSCIVLSCSRCPEPCPWPYRNSCARLQSCFCSPGPDSLLSHRSTPSRRSDASIPEHKSHGRSVGGYETDCQGPAERASEGIGGVSTTEVERVGGHFLGQDINAVHGWGHGISRRWG